MPPESTLQTCHFFLHLGYLNPCSANCSNGFNRLWPGECECQRGQHSCCMRRSNVSQQHSINGDSECITSEYHKFARPNDESRYMWMFYCNSILLKNRVLNFAIIISFEQIWMISKSVRYTHLLSHLRTLSNAYEFLLMRIPFLKRQKHFIWNWSQWIHLHLSPNQ